MKTTISITVDTDVLALAKTKTQNMSATINDFLTSYVEHQPTDIPDDETELKERLEKTTAELTKLHEEIRKKEKERKKEKSPTNLLYSGPSYEGFEKND